MKKFFIKVKVSYFKKVLLYLIFILFSLASARAFEITEIMYDPDDSTSDKSEWFEIYNDSDTAISFSNIKVATGGTNRSCEKVGSVEAGEYLVIIRSLADFKSTFSNYSGKVLNCGIVLANASSSITVTVGDITKSVNYIGVSAANNQSNKTSNTLNYPGVYVSSMTIGAPNNPNSNSQSINSSSSTATSSTSNVATSSGIAGDSSNIAGTAVSAQNFTSRNFVLGDLKLLSPKEIYSTLGAKTEFFIKSLDSRNNILPTNVYWSYGDGAEGYGATSSHVYYNTGDYIAYVEAETGATYGIDRFVVHVVNPDIVIKEVASSSVSILNNNNFELDLGNFIIASDQGFYKLSRKMYLGPKTTIKIDGRVLGFNNLTHVKILSPYGGVVAEYIDKSFNSNLEIQNLLSNNTATETKKVLSSTSLDKTLESVKSLYDKNTNLIKNKIVLKKSNNIYDKKSSDNSESSLDKTFKDTKGVVLEKSSLNSKTNLNDVSDKNNIDKVEIDKNVHNSSIKSLKNWLYWLYE